MVFRSVYVQFEGDSRTSRIFVDTAASQGVEGKHERRVAALAGDRRGAGRRTRGVGDRGCGGDSGAVVADRRAMAARHEPASAVVGGLRVTRILFLAPDALAVTPRMEDATIVRCSTLEAVYVALRGGPFEYLCLDRGPLVRCPTTPHA